MVSDVAWVVGTIVVLGAMMFAAYRIEPHWIGKDGTRFITVAQEVGADGKILGRRREVRVAFLTDGDLLVTRRALLRRSSKRWTVEARSPDPPPKRAVFLLRQSPHDPLGYLLALRMPENDAMVSRLDGLIPKSE